MLLHGGKPRCEQRRRRLEGHIGRFRNPMGREASCLPASDPASLDENDPHRPRCHNRSETVEKGSRGISVVDDR